MPQSHRRDQSRRDQSHRRDVAIVGVYATEQGRGLGRTPVSLLLEALHGALDDAGLTVNDIDGWYGFGFPGGTGPALTLGNVARQLGGRPMRVVGDASGVPALLSAAAAVREGLADVVVIPFGGAQEPDPAAVASYTRPAYEFTEWTGSTTPAQMALQARRHMHEFGTTVDQMAQVAATMRNHGHINPHAVMFDRGPYTPDDILNARMVADPFTLLMCSLTNDGGSCVVVTTAERARDCRHAPVWFLSGVGETRYSSYYDPPTLGPLETRHRARDAFARAGVTHDDIDLFTPYDHFPYGVIMALEAVGFCEPGEGGPFSTHGIGLDDALPCNPDGGNMAFSHCGNPYNFRIIEIVQQFRNQVADQCPGWREGTHTYDRERCRKVRDPQLAVAGGPLTSAYSMAILAKD